MEAEAAVEGRTRTARLKPEEVEVTGGLVGLRWRWRRTAGSKGMEELRGIMGNGRGLSADRQANLPAGPTQERCVSLERRPARQRRQTTKFVSAKCRCQCH